MPTRTMSVDLLLGPATASCARRLLRLVLEQWGVQDEDAMSAAAVVLSELLTNAERHCDSDEASVQVSLGPDGVRVAVVDCSPAVPQPRTAAGDDESGRGLQLIGALSSAWGVEPRPDGKQVFAVVPVATSLCA